MDLAATDSAYYHAVADLYDDMKADDNYQVLADLITQVLRRWGAPGRRLLDVGCGTGASSMVFAERGFEVVACDGSIQMLEIARKKLAHLGIRIVRADMRVLPEKLAGFDVVAWIDDVANHLLTDEDLRMAFAGARRALTDTGLFVFDVNTAAGFRSRVCGDTVVEGEDTVFLWRGQTPEFEPESLARVRIVAFRRAVSGWQRREGEIVERHFSPNKITALLAQAGLVHLAAYGLGRSGLTEGPDEEQDLKTLHIARRPASVSDAVGDQLQARGDPLERPARGRPRSAIAGASRRPDGGIRSCATTSRSPENAGWRSSTSTGSMTHGTSSASTTDAGPPGQRCPRWRLRALGSDAVPAWLV